MKQEKNDAFYRQHRLITFGEGVKYDKLLTDCNPLRVRTQKRAAHTLKYEASTCTRAQNPMSEKAKSLNANIR